MHAEPTLQYSVSTSHYFLEHELNSIIIFSSWQWLLQVLFCVIVRTSSTQFSFLFPLSIWDCREGNVNLVFPFHADLSIFFCMLEEKMDIFSHKKSQHGNLSGF